MRLPDSTLTEAERKLSWLFKQLQDFTTVSAWCGPDFHYDVAFHDLLDLEGLEPARADRLRRRTLVAMLMACLGALEEHWAMGVASDLDACTRRLDALVPGDPDEARLSAIVLAAFGAVGRERRGEFLDDLETFALDRDARWVHARFVRDALDETDDLTGDPPAIPPGLAELAREVAEKFGR